MNILITGKNGYIAKSLINEISSYNKITLIGREDFDLTSSIQTNNFFNNNNYFDVVIHTAITGGNRLLNDDINVLHNNLKMYYNLYENKNKFNKLINIGSGAEISRNSIYGLSKSFIRSSVLDTDNFYNLRVYAVFDENELDRRFIKNSLKNYINKRDIEIHSEKIMDFVYMKDLIDLIKYYIYVDTKSKKLEKEVECSYNKKYSLLDIANFINTLSDYKVNIINTHYETNEPYTRETNVLIENIINCVGLEFGIKQTYKKLKDNNV